MSPRPPHQPQRSCVACRGKHPQRELVRIALDAAGALRIDAPKRAPGRGAYLCRQAACWQRAAAGGQINAALRTELSTQDRARLETGPPPVPAPAPSPSTASPTAAGRDAGARYPIAGKTTS